MTEKDWVLFKTIADEKHHQSSRKALYLSARNHLSNQNDGERNRIQTTHTHFPRGPFNPRRRMFSGLFSRGRPWLLKRPKKNTKYDQ